MMLNFGVALKPSQIISFDIDNLTESIRVSVEIGIDLRCWLKHPRSVQIISGKPNRAKFLFRVGDDFDLTSRKLVFTGGHTIFELRYQSANGNTLQDLVPPSTHPGTGNPYQWRGDFRKIPPIPNALVEFWRDWDHWLPKLHALDPDYKTPPHPISKCRDNKTQRVVNGQRDPIAQFNASHMLTKRLLTDGYRQRGGRLVHPNSESGVAGLVLFERDGKQFCYSHGGDALNDGRAHDAFDVFRILVHGGNINAALSWNPEITEHNRGVWREKNL